MSPVGSDNPRIAEFLDRLTSDREWGPQVVHRRDIESLEPVYARPDPPLAEPVVRALRDLGVEKLYSHQVRALEAVRNRTDAIVATPTASGKSLIYQLPVMERLAADPEAKSLFLFPLKALEQDQLRSFEELASLVAFHQGPEAKAAVYDGDTPPNLRQRIMRRPPQVLITNPDMLHLSFLAFHDKWASLFSRLELVVLDEAHTYRGVFGGHVAQLIRRLKRICDYYGSRPNFLLSTATIDNPEGLGLALVGRPVEAITRSGAPRSGRRFMFINPDLSTAHAAARLLSMAVRRGLKTIVFTQARKTTELIHMWTHSLAPQARISAYRAGFLPSERRRIEADLAEGRLDGVVSTSALELGIDIGSLDVCILVGYPGTVVTTWQRAGRVGRTDRSSAVIMLAMPDALDQYIVGHPDDFFNRGYEPAVVNPDNPEIVGPHLVCASAEIPLPGDDEAFDLAAKRDLLDRLEAERRLIQTVDGNLFVAGPRRPHRQVNIRGVGESYTILRTGDRRVMGTIDGIRVFKEAHPGAIYLHRGRQYLVDELDVEARDVLAHAQKVDYYTRVKTEKETEILEVLESRPTARFVVRLGRLKVTETVIGYEKRRIRGQELMSTHPLDAPPQTFETVGLWVEIEDGIKRLVEQQRNHFMGGIHAMEHVAIAMFPLLALCDRNDIGGISYPHHPQLGRSAVFIYDGVPGGVGLARRGYENIERLLDRACRAVAACDCEEGCPSCIHSPKCGAGNKPLDKAACLTVLECLLGRRDLPEPDEKPTEPRVEVMEVKSEEPRPPARPWGVFDLETQRLAADVGGWRNVRLMGLSVGVVYDGPEDAYLSYTEDRAGELIDELSSLPLVVGFNVINFDYRVLTAYTNLDFSKLPTLDLLADIHSNYGFRIKLDTLARHTLGQSKSADGLKAVEWFRNGELDRVIEYCKKDVEVTRNLFEFGLENGHVVAERSGHLVKLRVDWAAQVERLTAAGSQPMRDR